MADRDDMSETECGESPEGWPQIVCDKRSGHRGGHRGGGYTWPAPAPAGDSGGEQG